MQPFRVDIPQADLDDLYRKTRRQPLATNIVGFSVGPRRHSAGWPMWRSPASSTEAGNGVHRMYYRRLRRRATDFGAVPDHYF
jgi:hypothetical protein